MAKRKLESDFPKNQNDFQRVPGTSNNPQNFDDYEHFESLDPEQELSTDLLEELSPLIRLNDRKPINSDDKPKKPKVVAEQGFNNRITILKPSRNDSDNNLTPKSAKNINNNINNNNQVCFKSVNDTADTTPGKLLNKSDPNIKLQKLKLNLSDSNAGNINLINSSPGVTLKLRAIDPELLNNSEFKEKVRKLQEKTIEDKISNLKVIKSGGKSLIKEQNLNNCQSSNSSRNSNSSKISCNSYKKPADISDNLVSTTTESMQSNECNKTDIITDVFMGLMEKMKERCKDIEQQVKKPVIDSLKDFKKLPTVEELMVRLADKDKLINQLQEENKDLTELLRKEKVAGNQLRINLMRFQKQANDLKREVKLKTELIDEMFEASDKIRGYFGDGSHSEQDQDDDDSQT